MNLFVNTIFKEIIDNLIVHSFFPLSFFFFLLAEKYKLLKFSCMYDATASFLFPNSQKKKRKV